MADQIIELGDRVRDKVTSFTGIACGESRFLAQCRQILVRPEKVGKDGKRIDGEWIDEGQLTVVAKHVHEPFLARVEEAVRTTIRATVPSRPLPRTGAEHSRPRESRR